MKIHKNARLTLEVFVKAPVAGTEFGDSLALSRDGSTLAVGAWLENSSATGVFAPGGAGYQAALDSNGAVASGTATVYRRSGSEWSLKAFVRVPKAGADDFFGTASLWTAAAPRWRWARS